MTDIEKIIAGLKILEKYKPDARFYSGSGKALLEAQEVEFQEIDDEDQAELERFGWERPFNPYLWRLYH